jgi:uncharacterized protein YjiS (DUF1127 family)
MLKAMILAYKRHTVYRATYRELAALSNKELYDLGIDRSMIEEVAMEATYGKEPKPSFNLFSDIFKAKTSKDKIEEYLSESENMVDLENRIKAIDRGLAPWQIRERNFANGWVV